MLLPKLLEDRRVVLLNCLTRAATPAQHAVIPDEIAAGATAATALLEAGHRHGIHLVGRASERVYAGRYEHRMSFTDGCWKIAAKKAG